MIFVCPICDEGITINKEDLKRGLSCPICHNVFEGTEVEENLGGKGNESETD